MVLVQGLRQINVMAETPSRMLRSFLQPTFYSKQASLLISNLSLEVTMDDVMRLFSNYEMHSSPVSLHLVSLCVSQLDPRASSACQQTTIEAGIMQSPW